MTNWTGSLTKSGTTYTAELVHPAQIYDVIRFTGTQDGDGALLNAEPPHGVYTLRILRKEGALRFVMGCPHGMQILGAVTREAGGRYALVQDAYYVPPADRLDEMDGVGEAA